MAQTTVFTYDICKQSKDDLAHITVRSDGVHIKGERYKNIEIDICPDCLKRKGFVIEKKETESEMDIVSKQNEKTLEDKIYDILSDIGVMFEE